MSVKLYKTDNNQTAKTKTYHQVPLNFSVDFVSNLDSILKTRIFSVLSKEENESKLLEYSGEIKDDKENMISLYIKIYVLPGHQNPIVVVIKNDFYKKRLENVSNFETTRKNVMSNFYSEINRLLELSKSLIRVPGPMISSGSLRDDAVTESIALPLAQSLNTISRIIDDNIEFCSLRCNEIKFKYSKCNIKTIIESVVTLFQSYAKLKNIDLSFQCSELPNDYIVSTDQDRLIQLMVHLLYNAIRFTQNEAVSVSLTGYNLTFKVMVEDKGCGITEEKLQSIKEEFENNDPKCHILFSKDIKNRGLCLDNVFARGLGPKSLAGLNVKSDANLGTSFWFIIENQITLNIDKRKKDQLGLMARRLRSVRTTSGHRAIKPSLFKMTYDYDTNDRVESFHEVHESIEIGQIISPSLEKQSARKTFERGEGFRKTYPFEGGSPSPQKLSQSASLGLSNKEAYIIVISKDIKEAENLKKISQTEGFSCLIISLLKDFEAELADKGSKIVMVIVDFEYIPSLTYWYEFQRSLESARTKYGLLATIIGINKAHSYGNIEIRPDMNMIDEYISKPFDQTKVSSLIRRYC